MKHSKLLLAAIFGLMTCQTAAAIDSHQSFSGSHAELEESLGLNRDHSRESMVYAKFDASSAWVEKKLTDNKIFPRMSLGFRYRNHRHGFDFSIRGHMPEECEFETVIRYESSMSTMFDECKVIKYKGVKYYLAGQLTYLYFTRPDSRSTFYIGAGAGIDYLNVVFENINRVYMGINKTKAEGGSFSGLLLAGYQFDLYKAVKSFLQFQISHPAYDYIRLDENNFDLKPTNQWLPIVTMSVGVGF